MSTVTLSRHDARRVLDAALARAEELGVSVAISVVDDGGNLKAFERMDGATFLNTSLATGKAIAAAGIGMSTEDFVQFAAGIPPLLAGLSAQPDVVILPGGAPITIDGVVVGAVGVAGGKGGEDHPVAEAGLVGLAAAAV
ncbi:heme-binding protein [Actinosynnema sp. NPDC059797]